MESAEFGRRVLEWFDAHGRKQLPWKADPTPYRVWVSEIMLQQTQVATAIPYYSRFMARFPDIRTLAAAEPDEVLRMWAGLGYYARARHLHQAARILCDQHGGALPLDNAILQELPGIGRSTAGAILALATGQRQPILDGNVKRLLARFAAVEGWPGRSRVLKALWDLAERYTPVERVADYTQAMMDLGAMVCTPRRPRCRDCPLTDACAARQQGRTVDLPASRPRRDLPVRAIRMLLLCAGDGAVLLEHRPPLGIWGGLWSFPECALECDIADWCREKLGLSVAVERPWTVMRHSFSHFHLDITPVPVRVSVQGGLAMEGERFVWYNTRHPDGRGVAAPVRRLLAALVNELRNDGNQRWLEW
ncbi:MAG: A/G-specific adenine glycosylase [Candidatus Competibacter sp.]|nr:A/G-specific adenine glycosylase [Candidatus Competibacter sp.]MDG4584055.1 A/G-specific adenine glycosylase [Candidatus Competibacter sp.]